MSKDYQRRTWRFGLQFDSREVVCASCQGRLWEVRETDRRHLDGPGNSNKFTVVGTNLYDRLAAVGRFIRPFLRNEANFNRWGPVIADQPICLVQAYSE